MKNVNDILKGLQRAGYRIEKGNGSRAKVFPPVATQPFYSLHIGPQMLHPLRRFAKQHWNININTL